MIKINKRIRAGLGFVRDSIHNLERNRSLLHKWRKNNQDFQLGSTPFGKGSREYEALQAWSLSQTRSRQKIRLKIILITLAVVLMMFLLVALI